MAVASKTWTVGEVVTAANMNTYVRDNLSTLQSEKVVIKTGTYVGDGSTGNAVTGVGFSPVYLKIWNQVADGAETEVFYTTERYVTQDAQGLAILMLDAGDNVKGIDERIVSLDADGFTVSDGAGDFAPNSNAVNYEYVALGAE